MLPRLRPALVGGEPPETTVAEIARAVPSGAKLQAAEATWQRLRARRDGLVSEQMALSKKYSVDQAGSVSVSAVNALSIEIEKLEIEINAVRMRATNLRAERAQDVTHALADIRVDAAKRALVAIAALNDATSDLLECRDEIRRAGDFSQPVHLQMPAVTTIEEHAQKILRLSKK